MHSENPWWYVKPQWFLNHETSYDFSPSFIFLSHDVQILYIYIYIYIMYNTDTYYP